MGGIVNSVLDIVGIGPASKQLSASKDAANQATQASNYAINLQREMFDKQMELQEPFRAAGVNALGQIEGGAFAQPAAFTGAPGYDIPGQFSAGAQSTLPQAFSGQVNMLADPGYQFRLSQGLEAMNRQAAARGGLISGAALKAGQRYGQNYASGEYGNAYDRALTEYNSGVQRANSMYDRDLTQYDANMQRSNLGYDRALTAYNAAKGYSDTGYNRLAALAGTGQTTSAELGRAGSQFGQNAGNLRMTNAANQGNALLNQGNIRASQYQNFGSALDQGLGMAGGFGGIASMFGGGGGGDSEYERDSKFF